MKDASFFENLAARPAKTSRCRAIDFASGQVMHGCGGPLANGDKAVVARGYDALSTGMDAGSAARKSRNMGCSQMGLDLRDSIEENRRAVTAVVRPRLH